MNLKEFLEVTSTYEPFRRRPKLLCKDGTKLSIQASEVHYCYPQEILSDGDYCSVEILSPILLGDEEPTETFNGMFLYMNFPVEELESVINFHGGIDELNYAPTKAQERLFKKKCSFF